LAEGRSHEALDLTIFSILLLLSNPVGQIPSSAPYSRTSSTTVIQNFCEYPQGHSNKKFVPLSRQLLSLTFPLRHK